MNKMKKVITFLIGILIVCTLSAQTENSFKYVLKTKGGIINTLKGLAADKVDSIKVSDDAYKLYQGATQLSPDIPESGYVNLGTIVPMLSDTLLYFVPNIGLGNAGDTVLFSYGDVLFGAKWGISHTLRITKVTGVVNAGADIDINLYTDVNFLDATPTEMLSSDLTITSSTTGDDATGFADDTIVSGEWLWIKVRQNTAEPTRCVINIYGYLE